MFTSAAGEPYSVTVPYSMPGGRVTIGVGANRVNVCKQAFDCAGQVNVQTLFPLTVSTTTGAGTIGAAWRSAPPHSLWIS